VLVSNVFGQDVTILNNFNAFEAEGNVTLQWVIKSGSTCNGISIFRSTDGINFEIIGDIQGVCGNLSQPEPYSFVDVSPIKNAINCYKLELGNYGFSESVKIEIIDLAANGYQIRPHPVTTESKIYFQNKSFENFQLKLFDLNGKQIYNATTSTDFFVVNAAYLTSGMYFFRISDMNEAIRVSGKLVTR
jgi:hypothetical protein